MATRLELANEAAYMIGNRTDLLPQLRTFVDRSYREVQTRHDHRILRVSTNFSTAVGTQDYALPGDFWAVRRVKDSTTPRILRQVSPEKWDTLAVEQRSPLAYSIFESRIWLWPTPDAIYNITFRYRRFLPTLADGDSSLLLPEFDDLIVLGAAARAADYLNEHDRALALRRMQRLVSDGLELDESFDLLDRNEPIELVLGD